MVYGDSIGFSPYDAQSAKTPARWRANSSSLPRIYWVSMDQARAVQRQSEERKIKVQQKSNFRNGKKKHHLTLRKENPIKYQKQSQQLKFTEQQNIRARPSPQSSLFKSVILRWGHQQHLATLLLSSVCGMETHLSISGLGQTEAIFSEDILAAADRLVEHEKDFVVLMWNMCVAWGFPELPKCCTHSPVMLGSTHSFNAHLQSASPCHSST